MNETRSTRYQRLRRRARMAGLVSGLAALTIVALTPVAPAAYAWSAALASRSPAGLQPVLALVLFVTLLVLAWELAAMPAMLYSVLGVSRRYGQSGPGVSATYVIGAQARSALVLLPVVVVAAGLVRLSVHWAGDRWWLMASLLLAGALILAIRQAPALVARVSGAGPLDDDVLRARLGDLADRAGVPVADVLVLPSGREAGTTALVTGVGAGRRVFLSSDVVRDWSPDEIAVVVAHELGHCVHQDAWRSMAMDLLLACAALGVAHLTLGAVAPALGLPPVTHAAALPAVALAAGLVWLAATPVRHAQSRRHERRADAFALALTGSADAFDAAIRRLGESHLAEERPGLVARWLFHRHPSVRERLEYARTYRDLMQV